MRLPRRPNVSRCSSTDKRSHCALPAHVIALFAEGVMWVAAKAEVWHFRFPIVDAWCFSVNRNQIVRLYSRFLSLDKKGWCEAFQHVFIFA